MNDPVSSLIIRQMDIAAARQSVLAHNLANFGTPGAVPKGASFETALTAAGAGRSADGGGKPGVLPAKAAASDVQPQTQDESGSEPAAPGQPVTAEGLEMQMARLADNKDRFSALARLLTIREKAYENAIKGT